MGCASKQNQHGFTLVEISIVMIIIGLLIGGTFGGMKLIENMQVNKTVQDLKAIESAALTFKDTYGRLPGDIVNPAARLPNCTVAPCATGGNGDRQISPANSAVAWTAAQLATYERFTFWSHLQAADLLSIGTKNTTNMVFDEGQPSSPIGGGYRLTEYSGVGHACGNTYRNGIILIVGHESDPLSNTASTYMSICQASRAIDQKLDDGQQFSGKIIGGNCNTAYTCANSYDDMNRTSYLWYDAAF